MAVVPMPYAKPLETAALPSLYDVITAIRQTLAAVGYRALPARGGTPADPLALQPPAKTGAGAGAAQ
jgi:hypothetical protein